MNLLCSIIEVNKFRKLYESSLFVGIENTLMVDFPKFSEKCAIG